MNRPYGVGERSAFRLAVRFQVVPVTVCYEIRSPIGVARVSASRNARRVGGGHPHVHKGRGILYGLLAALSVVVFSPIMASGNEIHVLFDFDLMMLLFTGESDPMTLSERYLDWYPNTGIPRFVLSVVLACLAVYKIWKLDASELVLGTTEAGRRSRRFVEGDPFEEAAEAALATGADRIPKLFTEGAQEQESEDASTVMALSAPTPAVGPQGKRQTS